MIWRCEVCGIDNSNEGNYCTVCNSIKTDKSIMKNERDNIGVKSQDTQNLEAKVKSKEIKQSKIGDTSEKQKIKPVKILKQHLPLFFVLIFALFYLGVMLYIVLMQYYTFHDDFLDLGVENQFMWLISHGYFHQFFYTYHYGYELEKPILFLIMPLYLIFPSPYTLLVLGTIALSLIPVPLYFLTKNLTGKVWPSALIAMLSIFYFPIASANLFNFHMMTLSPVLYLTMAMFWSMKKRRYMYLFAALTAMVDSLTLLLVVFFLIYVIYTDIKTKSVKTHRIRNAMYPSIAILCLLSILLVYDHFGLYTAGAAPTNVSINAVLLYDFTEKIQLFIYMFANTGFLPLMEPWTLLFMMPYIGFIFLSENPDNFRIFGLMFPVISTGPMFLGLSLAISGLIKSNIVKSYKTSVKRIKSIFNNNSIRVLTPFIIAMLVFALIYFPVGPLNSDITGGYNGYYNDNHDVSNLTHVDNQIVFLNKAITLIPGNGAVLTQDNIPQLSGRLYYQALVCQFNDSIPYNYLLLDVPLNYFAQPSLLFPIANHDLTSSSFGILAEGYGAMLLEKGYHGKPELYQPCKQDISPLKLDPTGSGYFHLNTIANNVAQTAYTMWTGPDMTILPGSYNVTFYISSQSIYKTGSPILDLVIYGNDSTLGSLEIYQSSFTGNQTVSFTIHITTKNILENVNFMGMSPSRDSTMYLHGISIAQGAA